MINALLSMGKQSLMNSQVGITVTGDNIANIDTDGYARRTVTYSTNSSITVGDLTVGTGASVETIRRNYDSLLEAQFLSYNSDSAYWGAQAETLYNVETLFTESDSYSVSTALDTFLDSLTALEEAADDAATRQELISYTETLIDSLSIIDAGLQDAVETVETDLEAGVESANALMEEIASLNKSIVASPDDLDLQDQRDAAVRELSNLLDVKVVEDGDSYTVLTTSGQTLVNGAKAYSLSWEGPQVEKDLTSSSTFDGELYFDGTSAEELLVEFTSGGAADGTAAAATFKVSLDGGETWVTDENGDVMEFTAGSYDDRVEVNGVEIWFGASDDSYATATGSLAADDTFDIMAKSGIYWNATTGGKVNITPLSGANEDDTRLSGGELAGLLTTRDEDLLAYQTELNAIANELIWQVNYQHSQGAGLEHYSSTNASNAVDDTTVPLAESSLAYADRLESGALSFAFYDEDSGDSLGVSSLDFSSITPGTANFDPSVHSLQDVADAINASYSGQLSATIVDGQLQLDAADGVEFEFAGDSSGVLAALGLNTFFSGSSISDMAVEERVANNTDRINSGVVNASGVVASGDNTNAQAMAALGDKDVSLDALASSASQTLSEHLHALVADVGADTDTAARNYTQTTALAEELDERQQEVAGVSLDEELTNLTRYQQAYQAASQLIQTANEMFEIVMSLKS